MSTLLSRALNALLRAAILVMPLGSLASCGPDFTTMPMEGGGAGVDAGADVDYSPIIVHPRDGSVANNVGPDAHSDAPVVDAAANGDAAFRDATASCLATEIFCGGACVANDARHCGSCDHDCTNLSHVNGPVTCLPAGVCSFPPSSCAIGWTHCTSNADMGCETDMSTTSNCGRCANACLGATPVCTGGGPAYACASGCPPGMPTLCGGSCVDTTNSATHCGTCATTCTTTASHAQPACVASACTIACNMTYTLCGAACVDLQTDPSHCGACATTCLGAAPVCLKGSCVACMPGATRCGGAVPQTCDANGAWQSAPVTAGQCGAACTPNAVVCAGTGATQTCTISGQWAPPVACMQPTPSCTGIACACPSPNAVSNGVCCPVGQTGCGGACVNLQTDNSNCGGCGLACGVGCSAGRCLVTLASGQGNPKGCAVDGTNVYWVNGTAGTVMKVPIGGGSPALLAAGQSNPNDVAVDGTNVYWTNYASSGAVLRVPGTGPMVSPTVIQSGQYWPAVLAVNNNTVYWANVDNVLGSTATVMKAPAIVPGAATTLAINVNGPSSIAADATYVYWTNFGDSNVVKLPVTGAGTAVTLASGQLFPLGIAVDATNVYWGADTDGTVMTVPLAGMNIPTTLASRQTSPDRTAVDATSVYWTNSVGLTGTVMKVLKGGGPLTTLATGQDYPVGICVDATSVYWTTFNGGTVMKLTPK